MQYLLEVAILPVVDVGRSLAFSSRQLDFRPPDDFRVVQFDPPGSSCSIQLEPTPRRGERCPEGRFATRDPGTCCGARFPLVVDTTTTPKGGEEARGYRGLS